MHVDLQENYVLFLTKLGIGLEGPGDLMAGSKSTRLRVEKLRLSAVITNDNYEICPKVSGPPSPAPITFSVSTASLYCQVI